MTFKPSIFYLVLLSFFQLALPGVQAQDAPPPIFPAKHLYTITSDFQNPSDVVAGKNGKIYVLDGVNNKVKVFNQQGTFLFSFGETGTGKGQFNFPLGIGIGVLIVSMWLIPGTTGFRFFLPKGNTGHNFQQRHSNNR